VSNESCKTLSDNDFIAAARQMQSDLPKHGSIQAVFVQRTF